MEVWQTVPPDGFVYANSETSNGYPPNSVGSVNTFFGSSPNKAGWSPGYIFGGSDWMYPSSDDRETFDHGHFGSTAEIQGYSTLKHGWGPLIGNPTGPLANLQYAANDKKWFWQGKSAPLSYSAEADAKIAQANAATITANTAAAVAIAKQMQADAAAAAEAQAKQDAANALQESAATSTANVAATQQTTQSSQLDLDTQKEQLVEQQQQAQQDAADAAADTQYAAAQGAADIQDQQAETQYAAGQGRVQTAAQQSIIDQASVWNKWASAHPDEAVAQLNASDDGGGMDDTGDAESDDGSLDDGSNDDGSLDDGSDAESTDDDALLSEDTGYAE
jgi:hypothetical protein